MRSDQMKKGITRAPHRSLFKAMGYTDEELSRPIIGIASSANEVIPGHVHLDKVVEAVKAGIRMAGGTPMTFGTIGICDGIAMGHQGMKYSLGSRELIADSVEVMGMAYPFDGIVLVPNCDKIIPGMLMAAARLNIPTIVVSGGPMLAGECCGQTIDLITVFEAVGKVSTGEFTEADLKPYEDAACPGAGSCSGMFTANSMNALTEALGLALPGGGTTPAVMAARLRLAKASGQDPDEIGVSQRRHRGHGLRRFDQHHPASSRHRPRGGHLPSPGYLPGDFRKNPAPVQHVSRGTPSHRRPPPGGRHLRPDEHPPRP